MAQRPPSQAVRGLQNFSFNAPQQFGNVAGSDPLGISLRQRSVASSNRGVQGIQFGADPMGIQRNAAMQSLVNASSDPQGFNTMMQAVNEAAPGGIRTPSGRGDPMKGLPTAPLGQPSTMWQRGQQSSITNQAFAPAMKGLERQKPKNPYQVG